MKKTVYIFGILILLFSVSLISQDSFHLFIKSNLLIPNDSNFSDFYGNPFLINFKGDVKILNGIYVFGGYAFTSSEGKIPDLVTDNIIKTSQSFLSFGAGFSTGKKFLFYIEGGPVLINWEEIAFDTTNSGNSTGFSLEGGINLKLGKTFLFNINLGYISAKDISEEGGESIPLSLGGIKSGIGLGIGF